MRLALAIGSLLILGVHGLVFYKQFFHDWERHQVSYFDQARGLAKTDAERNSVSGRSPRIEQFIVTSFGERRVDRCGTCHIAADDPRFEKYANPLKSHPYSAAMGDFQKNGKWERRHKFADFGCTICHDGQGRGLDPHYSHGEDHYWPDPLIGYTTQAGWRKEFLPKLKGKEYIEANCAQCHTEKEFAGAKWVERGRKLFFDTNCYGCHRVEGLSDGTLGPDLSESGHKFKLDYLWESVVDPRANSATSFMPKFKLSDDDVKALVIFLKSRRGKNFAEPDIQRFRDKLAQGAELVQTTVKPVDIVPAMAAKQGQELVDSRACLACHKLGEKDGAVAPDLTYEGLLKDEPWIYDHFKNPRASISDSIMPTFRFTDAEFKALTSYLAGLKSPPQLTSGEQTYKALCQRCHGEKGDGHGLIAVYLDPYPRDLTKAAFMNSKTEARLAGSIRNGVAGTSMPAWGKILDEQKAKEVLAYVQTTFVKEARRELKERKLPEKNPVAFSKESAARGEKTFVVRCGGCHGRKGDGKGPNSLDILPRPRNLRNSDFVASVSDKRLFDSILYGVQGTAMPPWIDYGMSQSEVGDLVNFIRSMNSKKQGNQYAKSN
ncbi:MAG: c-type cytochrome [Bryobacteraceae bacterium]|nr:c-type cytochrome [Bryobacteraceae bacterium]